MPPQVVYFHNPRFCRQPQLELARIPSSPMHMLPLIMQLLPEIPLCYDDDTKIPGLAGGAPPRWAWLAACGRFFLVDPAGGLLWAPELATLVAHYLQATGTSIGAADVGEEEEAAALSAAASSTAFGHVQLLRSDAAPISTAAASAH